MIPRNFDALNDDFEITNAPTIAKTYKLLPDKIQGFTDGIEALEQAIYKILSTEQYEHPIYGFSYGIELESLIGKDPTYVRIELKRRIRECLLKDDRITSVGNFQFEVKGDKMMCTCDVVSIYGNLTIQQEVIV